MFGIMNYKAFILASVLLHITPGADTIYILSKSASGGRRQGVSSVLGISTGTLIHTILAALGLSAILAASASAFTVMKMLGAAYLIGMGIRTILKKGSLLTETAGSNTNALAAYRQGVITNTLNPKVALFFLALLPQYVSPVAQSGPLPFLLLGMTFVATSTAWGLLMAFGASFVARFLNRNERTGSITNKVAGCIYIGLGLHVLRARMAD